MKLNIEPEIIYSYQTLINMKKVEELKEGDFIAFGFNYHGGEPDEIMVTNITHKERDGFIVHFLYGHHSLSEFVKNEKVLAIGNPDGKFKINGWGGKFDVLQPENILLKK